MQPEMSRDRTAPRAPATDAGIRFEDSLGQIWRVSERERMGYDCQSVRVLIFESDTAVRCVRVYPDDWRGMKPEALEYLSWRT